MKLTMKTLKLFAFVIITSVVYSCTKSPTEGIIQVIKLSNSAPIANATVRIYVDNPDPAANSGFFLCGSKDLIPEMVYVTSASGVTEKICFELPAVLKVEVNGPNGEFGTSTLSLEEGETTTLTVKVN